MVWRWAAWRAYLTAGLRVGWMDGPTAVNWAWHWVELWVAGRVARRAARMDESTVAMTDVH